MLWDIKKKSQLWNVKLQIQEIITIMRNEIVTAQYSHIAKNKLKVRDIKSNVEI